MEDSSALSRCNCCLDARELPSLKSTTKGWCTHYILFANLLFFQMSSRHFLLCVFFLDILLEPCSCSFLLFSFYRLSLYFLSLFSSPFAFVSPGRPGSITNKHAAIFATTHHGAAGHAQLTHNPSNEVAVRSLNINDTKTAKDAHDG